MSIETVDAVVIGMGPGGEDVATRLATAGLAVVGVEGRLVGGECPYYACVPTKMMVRAAGALAEGRRIGELAGAAEVRSDWRPVADRIRDEATDNWDDTVAVERFEKAGGRFVRGWGRITAPHEVTVSTADGDRVFRAERAIVLNPGTAPAVPPIEGLADTPFWTNREAVTATTAPESLIVLGGGPVGMEFAQIFSRFGAKVTVLVPHGILPKEEPEAADLITEVFAHEGITIRTGAQTTRVEHDGDRFTVHLSEGEPLHARQLLVATGRRTDVAGLGVGAVGLDESARGIEVDDHLRAADGVWAIGDITGKGAFTHMSMYQARIAANDILGDTTESARYHAVPRVTFTDPEVGAVGMTEAEARKAGLNVRTGSTDAANSTRGWIHKTGNEGLIKLVEDADCGILVGATSIGPVGGEVLSALAVAVHAEVPTRTLRQMIYAYPTFHRAIESALDDLS
ncbi:pyruvate/2-oxoglutarate dehydrogenase complex dihydrolipoamide dehydrogenase (E3) component [Nocardia transvalensis]|uniref:Pyruvate/2-oxoglutarate dehydrogenase complex dihydrolipoamide dehydrogenase (E3) component n=1 Tax=Nocardia transvalensis TaxID=37333 RepID=A0A7W9P9J7_9NOCA|nr:NAD(P)/FAD-dependent oxidoreductase [Nocardia transvalensis]MBB5911916.1 pyruvate/2-oxoglutarate dehydrogenase complex dihydrolipoamide dehydrogenase (E3) component [Nocardia transvalensis]